METPARVCAERLPGRASLIAALLILGLAGAAFTSGAAPDPSGETPTPWPLHQLNADRWWLLNLPGGQRLDASGLLRQPDGEWWIVNDQRPAVFATRLPEQGEDLELRPVPGLLTAEHVGTQSAGSTLRLDLEGLARDARGRVYLCEEARRAVFRWDPETQALTRLEIDWSPVRQYFDPRDLNASFEGIAVDDRRLYLANERQKGRLIAVDLATLKVVDDFAVAPAGTDSADTHYSDLFAGEGGLWVLLRDVRKLLKVDPVKHEVLAEFDYGSLETRRPTAYGAWYAPGFMEGVYVDATHIWLLSDNNGMGRRVAGKDTRPTLFRCPRPDK